MKYPILYIHGANASPDSFSYLIAGMPEHDRHFFHWDINKKPLTEIIADLLWFTCDEPDRPVHIVAHSMGGVLAYNVARVLTDKVLSVTTLATPFAGIELPFPVKLLHLFDNFVRNIDPGQKAFDLCKKPITQPVFTIQTVGGHNTLISEANDGVIPVRSQLLPHATMSMPVTLNHFEVLLHPSVRECIVQFIGDVEEGLYK